MSDKTRPGKDKMDIKQVRELVKLVEESGIEELEISHQDTTIRIQKSPVGSSAPAAFIQPGMQVPAPVVQNVSAVGSSPAAAADAPPADSARAKYRDVRSPIVGTFYRAPSPASDPFVGVGDHVSAGQTLCIIEAMKVMNEIEAEFSGTIREILIEDGNPVEAEGVLFLVDAD